MKTSPIKLSEIIFNYPVFEENQVLTDDHLNTVFSYLDQQDRLTRRNLHGYGIVCGLHVAPAGDKFTLSRGFGLTTDGDILENPSDKTYSDYRVFSDDNSKYKPFEGLELYELLADDAAKPREAISLGDFKANTQKTLQDFAAVLYLESYLFDPDICTGDDCDNKGQEQVNNLRLLLIAKDALRKGLLPFSPAKQYFSLPGVSIGRLRLAGSGTDTFPKLATTYQNVIGVAGKDLSEALSKAFKLLGPMLAPHFNNSDPTEAWIARLREIIAKTSDNASQVQYAYGFMRDLVQAYLEFTEAVFAWETTCLPDINLAPKHLLLGDAMGLASEMQDEFRHGFARSPALIGKGKSQREIIFCFAKIGRMIQAFSTVPDKEIRITPERKTAPLGKKAIPAYYNIKGRPMFNTAWDFDTTERSKEKGIYSYRAEEYEGTTEALNPLLFDIRDLRHFRIEGHLGRKVEEAVKEIESQIGRFNLPIKVVPLQIENDAKNVWVRPGFRYYGMEILHKLYRDELIHNLNELKKFNADVNNQVQLADDSKLPPVKIETNTISVKSFTSQQSQVLEKKIDDSKKFLEMSIGDFDSTGFENSFKEVVTQGAALNKGIRNVTASTSFTPLEKVINNVSFSKLKGIEDLIGKRLDRVREKSVFMKFLEENPGMEHTAGAPAGGTFILLYSSQDKKVLADMSLPYWYQEPPVQEVPEKSDIKDENIVTDWKFNNDFLVHISPSFELKKNLEDLDIRMNTIKNQVELQATNMGVYQGSINTLVKTLPTIQLGGEVLTGPAGGLNEAEVIKGLAGYREAIEDKKTRGTATDAEKAMADDMEKVIASMAASAIETISAKEGDVQPGSEDARVLEIALENASKISSETEKDKVREVVKNLKARGVAKDNVLRTIKKFRI